MSKMRSDSVWGKLPAEQRKQLDGWLFEGNLSYREVQERAEKEFGVKASRQSLSKYFQRREEEEFREEEPDMTPEQRDEERELKLEERIGAGWTNEELEAMTMRHTAMAAYELSMADPKRLRVNELHRLVKMLRDFRQQRIQKKAADKKEERQWLVALDKMTNKKGQTKDEFKGMMMETAEIFNEVEKKRVEVKGAKRNENKNENKAVTEGCADVETKLQNPAERVDEGCKKAVDATLIKANQP